MKQLQSGKAYSPFEAQYASESIIAHKKIRTRCTILKSLHLINVVCQVTIPNDKCVLKFWPHRQDKLLLQCI